MTRSTSQTHVRADFAGDLRLGRRSLLQGSLAAAAVAAATRAGMPLPVNAQDATPGAEGEAASLPNFLIMWGDDIGYWNISAYNRGMMGYMTPNIDRIAEEGALFQTWYGENSCTAGRAAFLTGQSPVRVGLTKVGLVGAKEGLQKEDPTVAELLKPLGYVTGQFGKNHLGDRNEHLPTAHGFDEFFGNLYHLNTHEEPEEPDYPQDPAFFEQYGPRGVIHSFATEEEDTTEDPRFGVVGKQRIEDTGPLTTERMKTYDEEVGDLAEAFVRKAVEEGKPFFCWWNSSRMHVFTHLKPESEGVTGLGVYADGMVETDGHVGRMLDLLDELGVADNTIVMYSTDNGAEEFLWPDGGTTPFKNEKATNWEGGFRVPCMIRWPGVIAPGTISNDIYSHTDMMPTILAAAGVPDIKEQLLDGVTIGDMTYRVHVDGYNLLPYWAGEVAQSPRQEFLYWTDDGDLSALRYDRWKIIFLEQRAEGWKVWSEPYVPLRKPLVENLLLDPFEEMHNPEAAGNYAEWEFRHNFLLVPAQNYVADWIASFAEFPPRQKAASYSLEDVLDSLEAPVSG